jgi:NADPH:quinone reductase-like Zn-dependent oxidoreductase/malonyl CoA-acyl carrier protein transacylase/NAD(P)-dependent dehydrogenase (short-subunit alcohol dehydrogenase family)
MGRELYEQFPLYASALDRASSYLSSIGAHFSLLEELNKDESSTQVNAAHISQPACTAVQLALVELLRSWRVAPTAVVGHSSGEIAAAYSAGIITFEDAMTIAYHRGRLIPILKERYPALDGCMMAVGAGAAEIIPLLERVPSSFGEARIACINSPSSVTISGDADAVTEIQKLIEGAYPGTFARRLAVDTAYHSHHMNLVAKDYTESLRKLQPPRPSGVRFHSSLLGRPTTYLDLDATYWVQNLICAVRFDEAVQSMCAPTGDLKTGVNSLIELGPHAALQGPVKQILKHVGGATANIAYSSALSRNKDAVQTALALAGTLFLKGSMLDMGAINFPKPLERLPSVLTDMPRYAWNHSTSYYHESRLTKIHKFHDAPRNDLIGVLAAYSDDIEPTWRNVLRLDDVPWLRHHQMQGVTIFPISGFVVMVIEAIIQQAQAKGTRFDEVEVKGLSVKTPAMLTEADLEMTITLRPNSICHDGPSFDFHVRSWSQSKGWTEHCTGIVSLCVADVNEVDGKRVEDDKKRKLETRIAASRQEAQLPVVASEMYKTLSDIGVSYGTTLQSLDHCHASPRASHAQIKVGDTVAEMPEHQETNYFIHPTILEQLITMYWPVLSASGPLSTVHLPSSIGKVTVSSKASTYLQDQAKTLQTYCEPSAELSNLKSNKLSMVATTDANEPLITIEDLLISPILETSVDAEAEAARELCYKTEWEPAIVYDDTTSSKALFDAEVVIIHGEAPIQIDTASVLSDRLLALTGAAPVTGSLTSLAETSSDKLCIVITELDTPILSSLDAPSFEALQRLLTTIRGALWVVRGAYVDSHNPDANMIMGLSRTLRSEGTLMKFATLDLDGVENLEITHQVSTIIRVFTETLSAGSKMEETEFVERDGQLMTPRIVNDSALNEFVDQQIHPSATEPASFTDIQRPLRGVLQTPTVLDSLVFEHDQPHALSEDEVEFQVKAVGINYSDAETDSAIGLECSGTVTAVGAKVPNLRAGDRVAGFTPRGSLSTVTRAHYPFLFKLPDHTTLESGAAIPLAYCAASYALRDQARLCEGETVLIHDAASATGQAALSITQMVGADVWATVRSVSEKTLLMLEFGIPEDRILYACTEAFAETIKEATGGRGLDVVFDTLTKRQLNSASSDVLAEFGRYISINASQNNITSTKPNTSTISVDIIALSKCRPRLFQRTLSDVARMLKHGQIQPIHDVKLYDISGLAAALHDVQMAGPHGKVVIVPRNDDLVMVSSVNPNTRAALILKAPRIAKQIALLRDDATYILIGGTGGLGRSMAKWMVSKGAKNIVLLSRSGELKGKAKDKIDALNNGGANIVVRSCDVADRASVDQLISGGLAGLPPVRGIIHGVMVLHVSKLGTADIKTFTNKTIGRSIREDDPRSVHFRDCIQSPRCMELPPRPFLRPSFSRLLHRHLFCRRRSRQQRSGSLRCSQHFPERLRTASHRPGHTRSVARSNRRLRRRLSRRRRRKSSRSRTQSRQRHHLRGRGTSVDPSRHRRQVVELQRTSHHRHAHYANDAPILVH